MLICQSCGNHFSPIAEVNGKKRKMYNRKHCLSCSPFGKHVTRRLTAGVRVGAAVNCADCGKKLKSSRRSRCNTCLSQHYRSQREDRLKKLVGLKCVFCDYGDEKTWPIMDFHHVDPKTKKFCINKRELKRPWGVILFELRKCVLACCRCHREITHGLIDDQIVAAAFKKFQSGINYGEVR